MMPASSQMAGTRAPRPRSRPLRVVARFAGHVLLLACWTLVIVMAVLMWGPHVANVKTEIVVGQSMEPTIPLYSVIVVDPVEPEAIRRGDVITYQQPDAPSRKVTHRVQAVERDEQGRPAFVTQGDNNDARDPYRVTYEQTGYRVRTHVPHVGWLMIQAQTRWARVLLVVVPVLVLLTQFLRWLWRDEDEVAIQAPTMLDDWDLDEDRSWLDDDDVRDAA